MGTAKIDYINDLINNFISFKIGGEIFEKQFTDSFDFEEAEMDDPSINIFANVRELLEHYTFSESDLLRYPDYYIDESQLRKNLIAWQNKLYGDDEIEFVL